VKKIFFVLIILLLLSLACLVGCAIKVNSPEGSDIGDISLYRGGNKIPFGEIDLNIFIEEFFGRDSLFYVSSSEFIQQERSAAEVQTEIDENLNKEGWRLELDWTGYDNIRFSEWKKGDSHIYIMTMDNLDSEDIRVMKLKYGFEGLKSGNSLTVVHIFDTSQPLPDLTSTAAAESIIATKTAETFGLQSTGTADAFAAISTETAEAQATQMMEETLAAQATQTAASAAKTAAVTPTPTTDPHPELALPFKDDFDDGLALEWRLLGSSEPVFVDGRLTAKEGGEVSIEIGNHKLNNYTIEFDLIAEGSGSTISFYFTSTRMMFLGDGVIVWYEFKENEWESTSDHSTNIDWGYWRGIDARIRIVRNGNSYEIYKDGTLEHTMIYGDPSGSKLIIQIEDNQVAIDNLVIQ
jgi:hypothetical protein